MHLNFIILTIASCLLFLSIQATPSQYTVTSKSNKIRIKREETQSDLTYENSDQTLPQDETVKVDIQPKQVVENESNSIKIQDDEEVSNAIKQSQGELPSSFFEKFMWSFVAAGVGLVGGIIGCVAWYFWTKEW